MSTTAVPGLVQEIRRFGRFDTDGCLNCGTCTVVCALSRGHAYFPGKSMQQALLGLKRSLQGALEPWLCHDCGDCATACPRQTGPRESMMTLRRYLSSQYDFTGVSSRIFRGRFWEIGAVTVVGLLVLALVAVYHLYYVLMPPEDFLTTPFGLAHMFPLITWFTWAVFLLPLGIMAVNAFRMYRWTMRREGAMRVPWPLYWREAGTLLTQLSTQRELKRCDGDRREHRWIEHWLLATGTLAMSIIVVFFLEWFQTDALYPLTHPQRWIGYAAAAMMILPPVRMLIRRAARGEGDGRSKAPDLIFPIMLLLVAVTGLAVHVFRYWGLELACHYTYALHVAVTVPLLLIELPFGKWSHVIYRPLALYFQAVKERAIAGAQGNEAPGKDVLVKGAQTI